MKRSIDLDNEFDKLNRWVQKSIELFENTPYIDRISDVYDFRMSTIMVLLNQKKLMPILEEKFQQLMQIETMKNLLVLLEN